MERKNTEEGVIKQVIVVRQDLQLPAGKLAAQVAHASTMAMMNILRTDSTLVDKWMSDGMAKIVLKIADENSMIQLFQDAKDKGLKPSLVTDAGRTVIAPGTKTCVGIGPLPASSIDEITGNLKLR